MVGLAVQLTVSPLPCLKWDETVPFARPLGRNFPVTVSVPSDECDPGGKYSCSVTLKVPFPVIRPEPGPPFATPPQPPLQWNGVSTVRWVTFLPLAETLNEIPSVGRPL